MDETFSQEIHARYSYGPEHIVWNGKFADVMNRRPDGRFVVDYTHFHEVVPDGPAGSSSQPLQP